MKILFIVPYTPNLIRVRPYNLIRHLAERGHQITLLTLYENEAEQVEASALEAFCTQVIALPLSRWRSYWNCLAILPSGQPLQTAYCWQPDLSEKLYEMVWGQNGSQPFDIIHIEHLRGVKYGLYLQNNQNGHKPHPPVVWDSVDCISHLFRQAATSSQSRFGRWVTRFDLGRTERFESQMLNKFSQTLVTSPNDKQAFLALPDTKDNDAAITILPNGVDLAYFKPDETVERQEATIVVSGKMSYHANITMTLHLLEEIMPRVWAKRPDVKLWVVGKDPSTEILSFSQHPNVTVTGTVDDIRPYLQQATVAAAPVRYGAGIQNKVLEAMACGTPVVTSPQTVSALTAVPGQDLMVAEDPETFAETLLNLIEDKERREALGEAGRTYIEAKHNWSNIAANLEEIYHGIISQAIK